MGPFMDFTGIVGANGSGKSNIADAILFCLLGEKLADRSMSLEVLSDLFSISATTRALTNLTRTPLK